MRILVLVCGVLNVLLNAACSLKVTQTLPPLELETSERGAFTDDGRFWLIGTRAASRSDAGSWIAEITRNAAGEYVATNFVAGALEGTSDGTVFGHPIGGACVFSGLTVRGKRLYAGCTSVDNLRSALIEVDTAASSVRAGYFDSCNEATSGSQPPCAAPLFYGNGMAMDSHGRIYLSNMLSHFRLDNGIPSIAYEGSGSVTQVVLGTNTQAGKLSFTHRDWFSSGILVDSFMPNGIQIEGEVLYYAAGPNINRVEIRADGSAGEARLHYAGPPLTYIDDFAVRDGRMVLARSITPGLVALERPDALGSVRELGTYDMDYDSVPSSVTYQADLPRGQPLFPAGSLIVTSFIGGGLYLVTGLE